MTEQVNRVAWWLPFGTKSDSLQPPFFPNGDTDCTINTCIANYGQTVSASGMVTIRRQPIGTYQYLIHLYHCRPPTNTCSPTIGVQTSKICMAHYGQTVSAQWLLLKGYGYLQMPRIMPLLSMLPFPLNRVMNWSLIHICWPSDTDRLSAFSSNSWSCRLWSAAFVASTQK